MELGKFISYLSENVMESIENKNIWVTKLVNQYFSPQSRVQLRQFLKAWKINNPDFLYWKFSWELDPEEQKAFLTLLVEELDFCLEQEVSDHGKEIRRNQGLPPLNWDTLLI